MANLNMSDEQYLEFVEGQFRDAANARDPLVFTNRGASHARAVLSNLVRSATQSLDLFTGCLGVSAYAAEEIRSRAAALPKGKVRILVEDEPPFSEASVLDHLTAEIASGAVLVRRAPADILQRINVNHFAVADNRHVRAEENHPERTATVVLNSGGLASSYERVFEALWTRASELKGR